MVERLAVFTNIQFKHKIVCLTVSKSNVTDYCSGRSDQNDSKILSPHKRRDKVSKECFAIYQSNLPCNNLQDVEDVLYAFPVD